MNYTDGFIKSGYATKYIFHSLCQFEVDQYINIMHINIALKPFVGLCLTGFMKTVSRQIDKHFGRFARENSRLVPFWHVTFKGLFRYPSLIWYHYSFPRSTTCYSYSKMGLYTTR